MELSESKTRAERINPQLAAAGWDLSDRTRVRFEVPIEGYDPTPWNGYTDYSLFDPVGRVMSHTQTFRAEAQDAIVHWMTGSTVYEASGDVPWYLLSGLVFAGAFVQRRRKRDEQPATSSASS